MSKPKVYARRWESGERAPKSAIRLVLVCFVFVALTCLALIPIIKARSAAKVTLILRTRDPLVFAPAALKHYSECKHVGAVRLLRDHSILWNLTAAHISLREDGRGRGWPDGDKLREILEDLTVPTRFIDSFGARPRAKDAILLVSDDLWINCGDLDFAYHTWRQNQKSIVGTMALGHVLRPDSGQHAWLDYKVSAGTDKHGSYSMVSLNGALVATEYLRQAAASGVPGCDEIWLNQLVAVTTGEAPIFVRARFDSDQHSDFSSSSSVYFDSMSRCLSRSASKNAGRLDLSWSQHVVTPSPASDTLNRQHKNGLVVIDAHNPQMEAFHMIDNIDNHRRKYVMTDDRVAGVSVVLVMETRPNEVASAVRHLHSRHSFIREAVVWNNKNETMNHHMFPYDISIRYVIAPKNYLAYSRYLGCMLARHEICYFQHERTRPLIVAGLYAAFLARPDVIVAASDPQSALIVRHNMTYFDASTGRLAGYADMNEGAMVHKDLVRQFIERMSLDDSRSFHERAADADLYFTLSQPVPPMVLTHKTWTNNKPRVFPQLNRIGKALAFTFSFAPSSEPAQDFKDPRSLRYKYFRAPCVKSNCTFATSIGAWPKTRTIDLGHNKTNLKPARYYVNVLDDGLRNSSMAPPSDSTLEYFFAVDGELGTVWRPQLPSKPSFIGLELLSPTNIVGVKLWCKKEFEPIPILQLGFFGHTGYQTAWCASNWTSDGALRLLHYKCPSMRVHRVRLLIDALNQRLELAEFDVETLDSKIIATSRDFSSFSADSPNASTPPPPPDFGKIIYAMHGDLDDYCSGQKMAILEEACELGMLYPGKVKLIYVGTAAKISLQSLARVFEVSGSSCDLQKAVKFESVPVSPQHSTDGLDHDGLPLQSLLRERRLHVYDWWRARNFDARVVFFDPKDSPLLFLLRNKLDTSPNAVFVARSPYIDDGVEESLTLADAVTLSSKADYLAQTKASSDWEQDRRIMYPLRTLRQRPDLLETPTIPAIEEVIVLVTPGTTQEDMELFNAHALPILQKRADVRLANVTALQHALAIKKNDDGANTDLHVKRPKWYTLRDVMYYVSIYPARVLWVLDTSLGAAYYASFASVDAARFVVAPGAIPHWESRVLAWNATCDWTPAGFEGKARELLQGRFNASSSFPDRDLLRHDASNVIVEEWPIKRLMIPFAHTVADLASYLAELVSARDARSAFTPPPGVNRDRIPIVTVAMD